MLFFLLISFCSSDFSHESIDSAESICWKHLIIYRFIITIIPVLGTMLRICRAKLGSRIKRPEEAHKPEVEGSKVSRKRTAGSYKSVVFAC